MELAQDLSLLNIERLDALPASEQSVECEVVDITGFEVPAEDILARITNLASRGCVKELKVADANLGRSGLLAICNVIPTCTNLEMLSLSNISLEECDAQELMQAVSQSMSLHCLELPSNQIGTESAREIGRALASSLNSLRSCCMQDNNVGTDGAACIFEALESNHSLNKLDLSSNIIRGECADALRTGLASNSTLQHLNIASNPLGHVGARGLAEGLARNSTLMELNGSSTELGLAGCAAVCQAMRTNSTLKVLNLASNQMRPENGVHVGEMLAANQSLDTLDLSHNRLGKDFMRDLCKAHVDKCRLVSLSLRDTGMIEPGTISIAQKLITIPSLLHLDLSDNNLGWFNDQQTEGDMSMVLRLLREDSALSSLNLSNNRLWDNTVGAIANSLVKNTSLQHLDISNNRMGEGGARALARALRENKTLTSLHVTMQVDYPEKAILALGRALFEVPRYHPFKLYGVSLATVADGLGLPLCACSWSNEAILEYIHAQRVDQLVAFVMGQHTRLGARSCVRELSEDTIPMVFEAYFDLPWCYLGRRGV